MHRTKAWHVCNGSIRALCVVACFVLFLFAFSGCGKSKEETAKEDAQGKQTNEQAMNRMLTEQTGRQPQSGSNGQ
jgi:hypothetical protein